MELVEGKDQQEKVQNAKDAETEWTGGSGTGEASRTGHCRTGQYLKRTRNPDTVECEWCRYKVQTGEHLFNHCSKWK